MNKKFLNIFALVFVLSASAEIHFNNSYDLSTFKGQSYLQFMSNTVKPANDKVANDGFNVTDADGVQKAYDASADKVKNKVDHNLGGLARVKNAASLLAGGTVTLDTLPDELVSKGATTNTKGDKYDLAAFLGLASGAGFEIKYAEGNYSLNVNYDDTNDKSGRSFGVSPKRGASDASDQAYLSALQKYTFATQTNTAKFYEILMKALLNSDTSNYEALSDEGQTLLTDFLAVMSAEQIRNLMDGRISPHWDAALLEVTLLANFHAGQPSMKLYYYDRATKKETFVSKTLAQKPCELPTREQAASLIDYWQYSKNLPTSTVPAILKKQKQNCRRSGINVTSNEFREIEEKITTYVKQNNNALYTEVKNSVEAPATEDNLYLALSKFLINGDWVKKNNPKKLDATKAGAESKANAISGSWLRFLEYTKTEAPKITKAIEDHTL